MNKSRLSGLFSAVFGSIALISSLHKPAVAALRVPEILGLIGAGMWFGMAFLGLIGRVKLPNEK